MGAVLEARGLVKAFGARRAVDEVDIAVEAGEVVGLLGPNGAGKTTTISMIAGVLRPDSGTVHVDGLDIRSGPAARARLGLVTQWLTLYHDISGRENLEFWGRMHDVPRKRLRAAVDRALADVGLHDRADDRVDTYSGGMQRRLNIAVALMHDPALLVLDEPCVGVDPQSRNAIFELVEARRDGGVAVLYTTHYMEEAERLCDRVGIIDAGRVIEEGAPAELIARLAGGTSLRIRVTDPAEHEKAVKVLAGIKGLRGVTTGDGAVCVRSKGSDPHIAAVVAELLDAGITPSSIDLDTPSLEDVFLELTGKALRD
ncbi:MAG: ABC transporter ATP-binding protein [Acidimicrobiia bacterium]|nr:ABC transporter ATP-binding protein [Acidimicrobiia bacterium]